MKFNFQIELNSSIQFINLKRRDWVEAKRYPFFTLLGQSLGSMWLGWEAMTKCVPDIFIDTMGYSFTFPLFKFLSGSKVACYVHYPTISTDMLNVVSQGVTSFNNRSFITNNRGLIRAKIIYYKIFAFLYGLMGRCAHVIMVNSSWTKNHINQLWKRPNKTNLVYPPCNVEDFKKLKLKDRKQLQIISISQFRPEKNHMLQLEIIHQLLKKSEFNDKANQLKLLMVGSCRNDDDDRRVNDLKKHSKSLGIDKQVRN